MKKIGFLMVLFALMLVVSDSASAQKECSKEVDGKPVKLVIINRTTLPFVVNYVAHNCREGSSTQKIGPGETFRGDSHNGHAYRVREVGTNKLLQEVIANPAKPSTTVGNATAASVKIGPKPTYLEIVTDRNPMNGFLKTLNSVRSARKLPQMQFDNALTKACQYLTDAMTKHNKMGHDPSAFVDRRSPDYAAYLKMNTPAARMIFYKFPGIPGVEAAGMVETTDVGTIGGSAIMQWATGTTHYRPFLSMDGQQFKYVGFGYTRVPNTDKYYTCAVFGNPK